MSGFDLALVGLVIAVFLVFTYFMVTLATKRISYGIEMTKRIELSELSKSLIDVHALHALARAEVAAMEGIKIDPSWPSKVKAEVAALRIAQLRYSYTLATKGLKFSADQLEHLYAAQARNAYYAKEIAALEQLIAHQEAEAVKILDQLNLWCDMATSSPLDQ